MALMKVKMLTSMAGPRHAYYPGQVVELPPRIGKAWLKAGLVIALKGKKKQEDDDE